MAKATLSLPYSGERSMNGLETKKPLPDPDGPSPDYARVKARRDAHEPWEAMSAVERRELILDTYPPQQWCDEPQLSTLAGFRLDAVQWGRILAQFRAIGGWPADLEKAVDAALGLPSGSLRRG